MGAWLRILSSLMLASQAPLHIHKMLMKILLLVLMTKTLSHLKVMGLRLQGAMYILTTLLGILTTGTRMTSFHILMHFGFLSTSSKGSLVPPWMTILSLQTPVNGCVPLSPSLSVSVKT